MNASLIRLFFTAVVHIGWQVLKQSHCNVTLEGKLNRTSFCVCVSVPGGLNENSGLLLCHL